jgi:hypothetical protein
MGRFTAIDPWEGSITNPQTLNKYAYTLNNPLKYVDPSGGIPRTMSQTNKIIRAITFDNFGQGKGWLANSLNQFTKNLTGEALYDSLDKQKIAIQRSILDPTFADETWDHYTTERIQKLDPKLHVPATDLINNIEQEQGKTFRVSDGYRTFEEQDALYAQGRFGNGGNIVTDARGGESYHNYGLAIDIAEIVDGQLGKRVTESIAKIGKSLGFEWGGSWDKPDYPHFQMTFGKSTKDLLSEVGSEKN